MLWDWCGVHAINRFCAGLGPAWSSCARRFCKYPANTPTEMARTVGVLRAVTNGEDLDRTTLGDIRENYQNHCQSDSQAEGRGFKSHRPLQLECSRDAEFSARPFSRSGRPRLFLLSPHFVPSPSPSSGSIKDLEEQVREYQDIFDPGVR